MWSFQNCMYVPDSLLQDSGSNVSKNKHLGRTEGANSCTVAPIHGLAWVTGRSEAECPPRYTTLREWAIYLITPKCRPPGRLFYNRGSVPNICLSNQNQTDVVFYLSVTSFHIKFPLSVCFYSMPGRKWISRFFDSKLSSKRNFSAYS